MQELFGIKPAVDKIFGFYEWINSRLTTWTILLFLALFGVVLIKYIFEREDSDSDNPKELGSR